MKRTFQDKLLDVVGLIESVRKDTWLLILGIEQRITNTVTCSYPERTCTCMSFVL